MNDTNFEKEFTITIPDEPFKDSTDLGKTVTCVYQGPRYVVIEVDPYTGRCESAVGYYRKSENINLNKFYRGDECKIILIDAEVNPFPAAYITHRYRVPDEIENYVFTHNGEVTWTYDYPENGIIDDVFVPNQMVYDFSSETFRNPPFVDHGMTAEEFWDGLENLIKSYEDEESESQECKDYITTLKSLKTNYEGIDHWKIPFPINDPFMDEETPPTPPDSPED